MASSSCVLWTVAFLFCILLQATAQSPDTTASCQKMTVPFCSEMGYNMTMFPNSVGHDRQQEAGLEIHQYFSLAKVGCSPQLVPFLCTLYFPPCNIVGVLPPCRTLCYQARSGCQEVMNKFGFSWPDQLNCEAFPATGLCIKGDEGSKDGPAPARRPAQQQARRLARITRRGQARRLGMGPNGGPGRRPGPGAGPGPRPGPGAGPGPRPGPGAGPARAPGGGGRLVNRCAPFRSDSCPNMSYSVAGFPNLMGQNSPEAAHTEISKLAPLIRSGCSPRIQDFVCGVHFPECKDRQIVAPCRSLCMEVFSSCAEFLMRRGFRWPDRLRCRSFPVNGNCFKGHDIVEVPATKAVMKPGSQPSPPSLTVVEEESVSAVNPMMSMVMNPVVAWLKSSTALNQEKTKLASEEVKVAQLTEQKLGLEINRLKREGGQA